jgi:outer membrane protein assembly factor BamB
VVALDRFTGKIAWVCKGDGERPGYNSPLIIRLPQRTVLVTFSAYSLMGIDARDGKLLWTHAQVNLPVEEHRPGNGDTHSNTVWFEDGTIFYIAGDGNGAVRLSLSPDGSSIQQVWRNPVVDNYMGGFIKQGNKIYSCRDSKKSLVCLDAASGAITDSLKCGTGTLISDGKMLYYYNQRGEMNLVNPGSKGMELISKFKVTQGTKEHFSHPVIAHGVLYLRHGKALMAWRIL